MRLSYGKRLAEETGFEPAHPRGRGRDRFRGGCDAIPLIPPWMVGAEGLEPPVATFRAWCCAIEPDPMSGSSTRNRTAIPR